MFILLSGKNVYISFAYLVLISTNCTVLLGSCFNKNQLYWNFMWLEYNGKVGYGISSVEDAKEICSSYARCMAIVCSHSNRGTGNCQMVREKLGVGYTNELKIWHDRINCGMCN